MNHVLFSRPKQYEIRKDGTWHPDNCSRVILMDGSISWQSVAACVNLLGEEYPALGAAVQLKNVEPSPGDLVIKVDAPAELEGIETFQQGYVIDVDAITTLTAQSEQAVLFGLRTIWDTLGEGGLAYGKIADYPSTKQRGLHLDMGRKYFTKEWLLELVRTLSRNRMNELCLHFSENEGFRIASDTHPEVPSLHHLSKDDIREIIHLAEAYHVDIIPALDCPGHLGQALQEHPRWHLKREMTEPLYSAVDITNPEARAFVLELIDEYAELFSTSSVFHIGGDEFIDFNHFERFPQLEAYAKEHLGPECGGIDTYLDFLNQIIRHVRAKGFQVRIWNDGLFRLNVDEHISLDRDVQIAYWTSWDREMAPVQAFLERGYQVLNYNADYLYYILLKREGYADPSAEKIMTEWAPTKFPHHHIEGKQELTEKDSKQFLGCCYSIWCDWPDIQNEAQVIAGCRDSMRAFAARCWGADAN